METRVLLALQVDNDANDVMRLVVETVDQTTRRLSHVAMTWPNQYALKASTTLSSYYSL